MIELTEIQASILTLMFEEAFNDDVQYFTLIDITELYALLLGEAVNQDIYDLIERTVECSEDDVLNMIYLSEFLKTGVKAVEDAYSLNGVEYWELANNLNLLKQQIDEFIYEKE